MSERTYVTRRFEWDAAHRVLRHESKCASLHGHRYVAEVTVSAVALDAVDRVVDFGKLKTVLGRWIDNELDHTTILNSEDPLLPALQEEACAGKRAPYVFPEREPTAEVIAAELFEQAQVLLAAENVKVKVERVRVYETPNCYAEVFWFDMMGGRR